MPLPLRALAGSSALAILCGACGLVLEFQPKRDDGSIRDGGGGRDAGSGPDAGSRFDAAVSDASTDPDGSSCPEVPCRPYPQCGCSAGMSCTLDLETDSRVCLTPGTAGEGEPCTHARDCQAGMNCIYLIGGPPSGVCARFCGDTSDCSGEGSICVRLHQSTGAPFEPPVHGCTTPCDPLDGTAECGGLVCGLILDASGATGTLCRASGPGAVGSPCDLPTDCAGGLWCVTFISGATTWNECRTTCRLADGDCALGNPCTSLRTPVFLGSVEYGICAG